MKLKHILGTLSLVAAFGVFAGVIANNGAKEAKEVKASNDYTKMFSVIIDMGSLTKNTGFNSPEVHYYGTNIDSRSPLHRLNDSRDYTVNIPYCDNQTIDHIQFLYKEGSTEKWSTVLDVSVSDETVYKFKYAKSWSGDNWNLATDYFGNHSIYTYWLDSEYSHSRHLSKDLSNLSYKATINVTEVDPNYDEYGYLELMFEGTYNLFVRNEWANLYTENYDGCSRLYFKEVGTYDIVIENSYSDGGVVCIYKHSESQSSYIYYVSDTGVTTSNYIYSFVGGNQFGNFPGTPMGGMDVTGVLHFQGHDYKFYKIPVTIGYPNGDLKFMFAYDDNNKSAERFLVPGAAYWWTGEANVEAGAALDFLLAAENYRNAVVASGDIKNYSICGISSSDAQELVNMYNALGSEVAAIYVDSTYVYTYNPYITSANSWVCYYDVVQQLAKIALGQNVVNSKYGYDNFESDNTILIVVMISIIVTSSLLTVLLIAKKKRNY